MCLSSKCFRRKCYFKVKKKKKPLTHASQCVRSHFTEKLTLTWRRESVFFFFKQCGEIGTHSIMIHELISLFFLPGAVFCSVSSEKNKLCYFVNLKRAMT